MSVHRDPLFFRQVNRTRETPLYDLLEWNSMLDPGFSYCNVYLREPSYSVNICIAFPLVQGIMSMGQLNDLFLFQIWT